MSWWYASTPKMTFAVEVLDGKVTGGAPIIRQFIGQPAKNLGNWLRKQGDAVFEPLREFDYVFAWGNNERRTELKGRPCRVITRGLSMRSVMVEFTNGERVICSYRALRKENP